MVNSTEHEIFKCMLKIKVLSCFQALRCCIYHAYKLERITKVQIRLCRPTGCAVSFLFACKKVRFPHKEAPRGGPRCYGLILTFKICRISCSSKKKPYYSKTCVQRPYSKNQKLVFKTNYRLMQVKSIAGCSQGSILQYFDLH